MIIRRMMLVVLELGGMGMNVLKITKKELSKYRY